MNGDSLRAALKTVAVCSAAGAVVGGILGAALGLLMPDYYRGVFEGGRDPAFAPILVGFGLGLTQGTLAGVLIGIVLLFRGRSQGAVGGTRPLWIVVALLAVHAMIRDVPSCGGANEPKVAWHEGKVVLWNFSLRDVMVTHPAAGPLSATLPSPRLLRSHMENVTLDVKRMAWHDSEGKPTAPPRLGEPIAAIFVDVASTSPLRGK